MCRWVWYADPFVGICFSLETKGTGIPHKHHSKSIIMKQQVLPNSNDSEKIHFHKSLEISSLSDPLTFSIITSHGDRYITTFILNLGDYISAVDILFKTPTLLANKPITLWERISVYTRKSCEDIRDKTRISSIIFQHPQSPVPTPPNSLSPHPIHVFG